MVAESCGTTTRVRVVVCRVVVPKSGIGGMLCVAESVDVGAVSRKVLSASSPCSSHHSHDVFSPALLGDLVLVGWCLSWSWLCLKELCPRGNNNN
jgi:hypothetical protein